MLTLHAPKTRRKAGAVGFDRRGKAPGYIFSLTKRTFPLQNFSSLLFAMFVRRACRAGVARVQRASVQASHVGRRFLMATASAGQNNSAIRSGSIGDATGKCPPPSEMNSEERARGATGIPPASFKLPFGSFLRSSPSPTPSPSLSLSPSAKTDGAGTAIIAEGNIIAKDMSSVWKGLKRFYDNVQVQGVKQDGSIASSDEVTCFFCLSSFRSCPFTRLLARSLFRVLSSFPPFDPVIVLRALATN